MRLRIQYTQQSSSWRRVARIVRANRMLRDRTLSITLRMVRELQSEEEFDQLINGDKLVLVDFFATWCPPCRMFQPILQNIEKEFAQAKGFKVRP